MSETKRHLHARTTLYLLLEEALAGTSIGSGQLISYDAGDPQKHLVPDAFVKLGSKDLAFDTWKIWERGAPDLAVEIVRDSDRSDAEWAVKLARYQASCIGEVVRFDPEDPAAPLRVWDRVEDALIERAPDSATLRECEALGLWWVVVPSDLGPLLRLARDRDGLLLLPTPSEDRVRLQHELTEERRARTLSEHERARELPARKHAEHARALAEKRADEEQHARALAEKRADEAAAEVELLRAEIARLRAER